AARELPRPTVRAPRSSGLAMALFIVPLMSWAILATIAVAILYLRKPPGNPHPLEVVPDVEGDNSGAIKIRKTGQHKEFPATLALPENLKVALNKTLRVGDIEVTPLRLAFARVTIQTQGSKDFEMEDNPALLLYLRVKNVAADYSFYPFDRYFTRRWKEARHAGDPLTKMPYTQLEIGDKRF